MAAETNDTDIMGTILFKPYQDLGSSGDKYVLRQGGKCKNLAKDIRNPQYLPYYTPEIHCTTEAIKFAAGHGASNIPSANGQVKYNGNSETRPNPKALAENMAKNGCMPAKIPPENNQ